MSVGVNIKTVSPGQSGTALSSSLPLPRSMTARMEPRHQSTSRTQLHKGTSRTRSSSSSSSSSYAINSLQRGITFKSHILQQTRGGVFPSSPAPKPQGGRERVSGVRSAYSSPQKPKTEAPSSRETLDLQGPSDLAQKALQELHARRNGNRNWGFGGHRHRSVDNTEERLAPSRLSASSHTHQRKKPQPQENTAGNGNVFSCDPLSSHLRLDHRGWEPGQLSNRGPGLASTLGPCPSRKGLNMQRRGSEPARINMAAVSPFRCRLQIQGDLGDSLDDLSDSSSDSMELCCDNLDPESQRKRTVQNVLDLRQNLEETMSSLRGAQLSHSCLDSSSNLGYDSDDTNARSISSLSNRSSPLSWRHGQASPRLQAGDAPSSAGGGASARYSAHTMPARCPSRLLEGLEAELKSGYLSDSDMPGGRSLRDDDDDNLANGGVVRRTWRQKVLSAELVWASLVWAGLVWAGSVSSYIDELEWQKKQMK